MLESKQDKAKWIKLNSKSKQPDKVTEMLPISYYYDSFYVLFLFWKNAFAPVLGIIIASIMAMHATQNLYFWLSVGFIIVLVLAFFIQTPLIGHFYLKDLIYKWNLYFDKKPFITVNEEEIVINEVPVRRIKREDILYAKVLRNEYNDEVNYETLQIYFSDSYYEQNNLEFIKLSLHGLDKNTYELSGMLKTYTLYNKDT